MKINNLRGLTLTNASETVELTNNNLNSEVVGSVYLQVDGTGEFTLTVKGKADADEDNIDLAVIKMSDLTVASSITADGVYLVITEALTELTLTATGTVNVLVKGVK